MLALRVVTLGLMVVLLAIGANAEPIRAPGQSSGWGYDAVGQAESVLKRAAVASPRWHSKQDTIQRDVYDITMFLEQAVKAAEKRNDAAMKDSANQALTLLQRAVRKGHFDPNQIEPVLALIRQLLPDVSV
ncbi:MAG TPA: hypothetical protein VFS39_19305 [Nitrospira sp.]|nr:hypothetical protein [Nitrospira sp.]